MLGNIKAILVDDEENAVSILEMKINKFFPNIQVIKKYTHAEEAIQGINELQPDLLFLDIKMPGYNGFELLDHIVHPSFELIFVTAYDHYALDAIKECAIGYILKPIDENELKSAVLNALNNIQQKKKSPLPSHVQKITIPFNNGFMIKNIDQIIRCEGFSGYTKIFFTNAETVVSSYSIGLFNSLLHNAGFVLVHKSHMVNIEHVMVYYNEGVIELSNKDKIPVSKSNRTQLIHMIKNKL